MRGTLTEKYKEAIDLIYANLGALPHPDYGVINLLPFAVESDQTNELKRQVCEGIVRVLADAGFDMGRQERAPAEPTRNLEVKCRLCSTTLANFNVSDGVANVPAATLIAALSKLHPECPHAVMTADDQRRAIEEAVLAQQGLQAVRGD